MKTEKLFEYDKSYNIENIAGVDEAGRGPLAGPLVCAACIMPLAFKIDKINDSKKVSELTREKLYDIIIEEAIAYNISIISEQVIDDINILNATRVGMSEAVNGLKVTPSLLLSDAVKDLKVSVETISLIKGDAISYNIAAASILAKVFRDRIMREFHIKYPEFNFLNNKGYGTKHHIDTLKNLGKTPIHRESFIKNFSITNRYGEKSLSIAGKD